MLWKRLEIGKLRFHLSVFVLYCLMLDLDALLLENYWVNHKYHHTTPTNMNFALYTALKNIVDEGLENVLHFYCI